ncbi:MAG: hypothetical protein JW941_09320 [Candidatus Coatesbacteria bacterium]|nr:hypothetical protein [Candidatus Coatesbacteria bacterium]
MDNGDFEAVAFLVLLENVVVQAPSEFVGVRLPRESLVFSGRPGWAPFGGASHGGGLPLSDAASPRVFDAMQERCEPRGSKHREGLTESVCQVALNAPPRSDKQTPRDSIRPSGEVDHQIDPAEEVWQSEGDVSFDQSLLASGHHGMPGELSAPLGRAGRDAAPGFLYGHRKARDVSQGFVESAVRDLEDEKSGRKPVLPDYSWDTPDRQDSELTHLDSERDREESDCEDTNSTSPSTPVSRSWKEPQVVHPVAGRGATKNSSQRDVIGELINRIAALEEQLQGETLHGKPSGAATSQRLAFPL